MTTPKPSEQEVETTLHCGGYHDGDCYVILAAEVRRLRTENERILEGRNIAESAMSLLRAELAAVKERVAHWEASSKLHSDSATKWHGQVAALTRALAESRGREDKKGKALKAVYRWLLSAEKLLKDADISGIDAVILLCHGITADTAKPCQDCLGPGVPICATCGQCPEHCPDSPQASAKRCGTPGCSGRGHADSAWPTPPQQEKP